jgi:signal peptidase I
MSARKGEFTKRKRRSYLWGGMALLVLAAGASALNAFLPVPDYQKVSWLLIAFSFVSGASGVAVAKHLLPQRGKIVEYGEALVVAILLAVAIRGAVVQAFKIPSGSMLPTLQIGDHLLVSKFLYGVRIPYTGIRLFRIRPPKRGDIVVFAYPEDDSKDFIKRVIGEPGDRVEIVDKKVYVNGDPIEDPWGVYRDAAVQPGGIEKRDNTGPLQVPRGRYFVMGDNRDRSYDSRFWGFVDDARIKGKAFIIYWSWESERTRPRFGRMGQIIH